VLYFFDEFQSKCCKIIIIIFRRVSSEEYAASSSSSSSIYHLVGMQEGCGISPLGGPVLRQKNIWWYLGFYFDKKLTFQYHAHHYTDGENVVTRVNITSQRNRLSELLHSCMQTSRHRGDKSEMRKLTDKNE